MNAEARYEEIQRWLDRLRELNEEVPILVEGPHDAASLRSLGCKGTIQHLNRGTTLFAVCEVLARRHRRVVVLTDWDTKGGRLFKAVRAGLAANGAVADGDVRAQLATLTRRELTDVEGLPSYLSHLRPRDAAGRRRPNRYARF